MAEHVFTEQAYAFIDELTVDQLREIARCAMDLAWPPYFVVAGSPQQPPIAVDVTVRLHLQMLLLERAAEHNSPLGLPSGSPDKV